MSRNKNQKFPLLSIILLVALLLRIAFILVFLKEKLYWDDEFAYDRLAIQLIEQRAYVNEEGARTAFRAPGYPLFLALNYLIFGRHFWTTRMVQAFIDCLTLILIFLIARQMFNQNVANISALLYAIYPLFIYTSSTFFPTTLFIFLLALFLYFIFNIDQKKTFLKLMMVGIVAGIAVLTVPTILIFILLALIWLFFDLRKIDPRRLCSIGIIMLFMILTLLPWLMRNYRVYQRPFLIATNSGYNFWMGNNPWATPTTGNSIAFPDSLARKLSQAKSEVEQEKIFYQDAFQYIKKNPGKFIALTFKKAMNLWQFYPTPTTGYKMLPTLSKLMSIFSYGPVLLLAIFGLVISWREKKKYVLLFILLFLSFTISYAFFITKARFRLPLDPYLIILAGVTIRHFWENRKIIFCKRNIKEARLI